MADNLTTEQRHRNMVAIRGKDTRPELTVRRLVHRLGFRFRLHRRELPGCPDLVLPRLRKAIFVHGCFWHSHRCKRGALKPATRSEFWQAKRDATIVRDRRSLTALRNGGWKVLVVWECQLRNAERLSGKIRSFLNAP